MSYTADFMIDEKELISVVKALGNLTGDYGHEQINSLTKTSDTSKVSWRLYRVEYFLE